MLTTLIQEALYVELLQLRLLALSLSGILSFVRRLIRIRMHRKEVHRTRKFHRSIIYSLPIYIREVWVLFDLTVSIERIFRLHSDSVLWEIVE